MWLARFGEVRRIVVFQKTLARTNEHLAAECSEHRAQPPVSIGLRPQVAMASNVIGTSKKDVAVAYASFPLFCFSKKIKIVWDESSSVPRTSICSVDVNKLCLADIVPNLLEPIVASVVSELGDGGCWLDPGLIFSSLLSGRLSAEINMWRKSAHWWRLSFQCAFLWTLRGHVSNCQRWGLNQMQNILDLLANPKSSRV